MRLACSPQMRLWPSTLSPPLAGATTRSRCIRQGRIFSPRSLPLPHYCKGKAPHDVLLLELIMDASGGQSLAGLNGLARELGLRIIVLTTAGRDAITLTQPALPALCLRQLPLP